MTDAGRVEREKKGSGVAGGPGDFVEALELVNDNCKLFRKEVS